MATVLTLAAVMIVAFALAWRHWRGRNRLATVVAGTGVAVGTLVLGVSLWAVTATDTSQLARSIVWGSSGYGDQDRFPTRAMSAAVTPVTFAANDAVAIDEFVSSQSDARLPELAADNASTAFIVLHGDDLLYESYFNGSDADATQTSFSVAKSFIATLVGIAIDEGFVTGLDEPITTHVPELLDRDPRFGEITLHHLITMSSGLSFAEGSSPWADPANSYHGTNLRDAVVDIPDIEQPPGERFHYNDWNVILLGLILERATDMPVSNYMQTRLWQPMGASGDGSWSLDSDQHGFEKMFVGVNGRAIDFAKLGWLYLHDGSNGDTQIVPAGFVADATRADDSTNPALEYQYLWWVDHEHDAFHANGDHGQFIYVDPAAEIVIVRHGSTPGSVDWVQLFGELVDWIEPQLAAS